MKPIYSSLLRIVIALLIGILMITNPQFILSYIALVLGLLLIIPALVVLLRYIIVHCRTNRRDRRNNPIAFPFLATLSIIAGIAIIVFQKEITMLLGYVLAVGLILVGTYEIVSLFRAKERLNIAFYIMPILLIILGIFIIINPLDLLANVIIILFGCGLVVYSINEFIYLARVEK